MANPLVFTLIVTYNGAAWLDRCLPSLAKSSLPTQVVVVDNGSSDGTLEQLKQRYNWVHLIENTENMGFGRGNNMALRYALEQGASHVFLLNQDAWIAENTLTELVQLADSTPTTQPAVVSPLHLNGANTAFDRLFLHYLVPPHQPDFVSDLYLKSLKNYYEVPFINAAAWLISRETIEKIGGFNPVFPHYGEDVNWVNRLKQQGGSVFIASRATVWHDRENRPVAQPNFAKEVRKTVIDRLIRLSNPNQSFLTKVIIFSVHTCGACLAFLAQAKFRKAANRAFVLATCLYNLPTIYYYRQLSTQSPNDFLTDKHLHTPRPIRFLPL